MFTLLFNFFSGVAGWLGVSFGWIWKWLTDFSRLQFWIFASVSIAIIGSIKAAFSLLTLVDTSLTSVVSHVGSAGAGAVSGGGSPLAFINFLFPLNETFAYCVAYIELSVVLIVYKFIRSWIPKIAGFGW